MILDSQAMDYIALFHKHIFLNIKRNRKIKKANKKMTIGYFLMAQTNKQTKTKSKLAWFLQNLTIHFYTCKTRPLMTPEIPFYCIVMLPFHTGYADLN